MALTTMKPTLELPQPVPWAMLQHENATTGCGRDGDTGEGRRGNGKGEKDGQVGDVHVGWWSLANRVRFRRESSQLAARPATKGRIHTLKPMRPARW